MSNSLIDTKRIKLGKVTYFDTEHNGTAVPSVDAYVFLVNVNGTYVNPFNVASELPVYDRVPYTNTTRDGEDFGTKIVLANGEVKDGPCYVIEKIDISSYYGEDQMSVDMLRDVMLKSDKFFVDRLGILEDKPALTRGKKLTRKMIADRARMEELRTFLSECNEAEVAHQK